MPKMPRVRTMGKKQVDAIMNMKAEKHLLRTHMKDYQTLYVFSHKDLRPRVLKDILAFKEFENSKLWIGKNKLIRGVLNEMIAHDMHMPDLGLLLAAVKGPVGLLFTNSPPYEVHEWFNTVSIWDYPHAGYIVTETIKLDKGPLKLFRPEIEQFLRQLGMDTEVVNGVVMLKTPFLVCRATSILSKLQVNLLELLGEKLAVFQLHLKAAWTKKGGLQVLESDESDDETHSVSE